MGIFDKIKAGLKRTKDRLGKMLFEIFKAKALDDDFYEELENALIYADMGVTATEAIIEELKEAVYQNKIVEPAKAREELKRIMLESIDYEIPEYEYPLVILVAGVNGVGKTTAIGKLAKLFVNQGKSVIVAAADTFRAAASDQLEVWAERAGVRIVKHSEGSDPAAVVFDAISSAKARNTEVILVDTAGRLHNKKNLMDELNKISRVIDRELPESSKEVLLVLDATTGQNAVSQVKQFKEAAGITGIILTKLDGTAKGGIVIAISHDEKIPVKFIGVGEGIDDMQPFNPDDFVSALF